jgi:hypothetical protein
MHGRAAVVVPDNVLFEGGAGEIVWRQLLHECPPFTLKETPPVAVARDEHQGVHARRQEVR